jgi:hypothetical protein
MKYLLMIYMSEQVSQAEDGKAMNAEYAQFGAAFKQQILGGNALKPTSTATTVRLRDGKRLVTDGPFAETKEQLGGYYLIEAANIDEAIHIASKVPGAARGSVEVRPLLTFA